VQTRGLPGQASFTVGAASGTVPNDYVIDIDLTATTPPAFFTYDPTTGADLLIDVTVPLAPAPKATASTAAREVPFSARMVCTSGSRVSEWGWPAGHRRSVVAPSRQRAQEPRSVDVSRARISMGRILPERPGQEPISVGVPPPEHRPRELNENRP